MEKQLCRAWHVAFVSICVCLHSVTTEKNAKPKSLSPQWYFKRIPDLQWERKISCFWLVCLLWFVFFFLELEIHHAECTNRGRPGRLSCAKPSFPEQLEKTSWHPRTGQRLLGLEGWAGMWESVPALPASCCLARRGLKGCPSAPWFRGIWRKKVCLFFPGNQKIQREMPFILCYFGSRKKLCFMLLEHCLWLSKSCPEEKGGVDFEVGACWDFPSQVNKFFPICSVFESSFASGPWAALCSVFTLLI